MVNQVQPVKLAIVGAGQRGAIYAAEAKANPKLAVVVAVADPKPMRRNNIARTFQIPRENVHEDWKDLLCADKVADAVIIATLDDSHRELVHEFAARGYHILCEKPMATSIADCLSIIKDVKVSGVIFGVGHVLRYSPYNVAVKKLIDSGALGEIINIEHSEPVGFEHFAHSYVRGNWRKESETSFSLMTKCCHDLDILSFYYSDAAGHTNPAVKVSSFGSLTHFRPDKKPKQAKDAMRCLECAYEPECQFSAKKIYLDPLSQPKPIEIDSTAVEKVKENRAIHFVEAPILDIENVTQALETGQYGLCVYNGQNDVVDQQVVNIQYETGATASLTMIAFSEAECERQTRIHGTKGELIGDMTSFTVFDFGTKQKTLHTPAIGGGGHGGGDGGLSLAFFEAVQQGSQMPLKVTPDDVLSSHLLVFAAEASRREERVVRLKEFIAGFTDL